MQIMPVKGMRDFYPQQMAVRNFIVDGWKSASLRNGFQEYDGPILEYLKIFQVKSGEEIVEQLFSLKDRGGRDLAIRPEITPTLARMVNQQVNSLPKPIKWFSVPRLCRAERPQKGRLREFFQWNIDIIGQEDKELADAEVIFTTLDYLQGVGLTERDVKVRISSRNLLAAVLKEIGISKDLLDGLYVLLDKKSKLPADVFEKLLFERVCDAARVKKILAFTNIRNVSEIKEVVTVNEEIDKALDEQSTLIDYLSTMGVGPFCRFDPGIVRGLAYYTGIVFEVHDLKGDLRAIAGGGRYDNLLEQFGGPQISGTGMGMGDCVLEILLRDRGLLKPKAHELDYFVAVPDINMTFPLSAEINVKPAVDVALELTAKLRMKGKSAVFSFESGGLARQLKEASSLGAKKCVIIGQEYDRGELLVKDMSSRNQERVTVDQLLSQISQDR